MIGSSRMRGPSHGPTMRLGRGTWVVMCARGEIWCSGKLTECASHYYGWGPCRTCNWYTWDCPIIKRL